MAFNYPAHFIMSPDGRPCYNCGRTHGSPHGWQTNKFDVGDRDYNIVNLGLYACSQCRAYWRRHTGEHRPLHPLDPYHPLYPAPTAGGGTGINMRPAPPAAPSAVSSVVASTAVDNDEEEANDEPEGNGSIHGGKVSGSQEARQDVEDEEEILGSFGAAMGIQEDEMLGDSQWDGSGFDFGRLEELAREITTIDGNMLASLGVIGGLQGLVDEVAASRNGGNGTNSTPVNLKDELSYRRS